MARRRLKVFTPQEVRTTLAKVINMMYNGEMDVKTGNTIVLACNAVLSAIRTDEQEKKIRELEQLLMERDK